MEELETFTLQQIDDFLISPASEGATAAGIASRIGIRRAAILSFLDARPEILLKYAQARAEFAERNGAQTLKARIAIKKSRERVDWAAAAASAATLPVGG